MTNRLTPGHLFVLLICAIAGLHTVKYTSHLAQDPKDLRSATYRVVQQIPLSLPDIKIDLHLPKGVQMDIAGSHRHSLYNYRED